MNLKESALKYANMGLAVFPLLPNSKKPATTNGVKNATTNADQINAWWEQHPNCNIGIATGKPSGGLLVIDLDIDENKGVNGYETLKEWQNEHGELAETWQGITGRGGYHLFYRDVATNQNRVGLYEGVDIRGEGGYIVAPPSLHENGNTYQWEVAPEDMEIAQVDNLILEFLAPGWGEIKDNFHTPEVIPDGERNSTLYKLACSMVARGDSKAAIMAAVKVTNEEQCRPPLKVSEIKGIVESALKYESGTAPYKTGANITGDSGTFGTLSSVHNNKKDFEVFEFFENLYEKRKYSLPKVNQGSINNELIHYSNSVSRSIQVPFDMVVSCVLAAVSLCSQGKYETKVKENWMETANIYMTVIAKPSEKKTPTLKIVTEPIVNYVLSENERRQPFIDKYNTKKRILENKITKMENELAKPTTKKSSCTYSDITTVQEELRDLKEYAPLQLMLDDFTTEALVRAMAQNNEKMGIVSAEGGVFGMLSGRYGNHTNIDIFLKGYSCESYSTVRMGRKGEDLKKPLLTTLLMIQPHLLNEVMSDDEFRGRGLLARFLYCIPESMVGTRKWEDVKMDKKAVNNFNNLIERLLAIPDSPTREITLSTEASVVFKEFHYWVESKLLNELEAIEDWGGKLLGQAIKIATIMHVSEHVENAHNVPISKKTMEGGIDLAKYYMHHALAAFDMAGVTETQDIKDAKYIISRIDLNHKNFKKLKTKKFGELMCISKRNLFQMCRSLGSVEDMQPGLDVLESKGYIRVVKQDTGKQGRPTELIYFSPEAVAGMKERNR